MAVQNRILVVDDEQSNLDKIKELLQDEYDLVLISSGKECMEYLKDHTPDLMLLDFFMPNMDGLEVMKKVKTQEHLKDVPVIFMTADNSAATEIACFASGGFDFCVKPLVKEGLIARVNRGLELKQFRDDMKGAITLHQSKILDMQYNFVTTMATLIENRDGTDSEHVFRLSAMVERLAVELRARGLFEDEIDDTFLFNLKLTAPMHDFGKIKIKDGILSKPGRLTATEYEEMKQHTLYGDQIIGDLFAGVDAGFLQMAKDIAKYHHEKYNGLGYPEGLKEKEIPLAARIVAIIDVFDALKEKRAYKDSFPLNDVYEIMEEECGKSFDPEIMKVFMEIRSELEKL